MIWKKQTALTLLLALPLSLSLVCLTSSLSCPAAYGESQTESGPSERITFSNLSPKQGEVVEVKIFPEAVAGSSEDSGENGPSVEFNSSTVSSFPFQENGRSGFRALFTVPVVLKTGSKTVKVGSQSFKIKVVDGKYPVQRLWLPASKNNFNTAPGEEEAVDKAKATVSSVRHWKGNFSAPSKARTSAGFGLRRIVNGKLLDDYFHSGVDFAGGLGSPVKATAPGKVILAVSKGFKLHGNTIAIDHGQGVVSFYIHLNKVLVKEGQMVKQGDLIGQIGQTGRANGPHLHFSIYCNKNASMPSQWFNNAL